jgi:hypothetical protein
MDDSVNNFAKTNDKIVLKYKVRISFSRFAKTNKQISFLEKKTIAYT